MPQLRSVAMSIAVALVATAVPTAAAATGGGSESRSRTSGVDFGACTELSTGTTVPLAKLQARVPDAVPVLSLTDQGFVFPRIGRARHPHHPHARLRLDHRHP